MLKILHKRHIKSVDNVSLLLLCQFTLLTCLLTCTARPRNARLDSVELPYTPDKQNHIEQTVAQQDVSSDEEGENDGTVAKHYNLRTRSRVSYVLQ